MWQQNTIRRCNECDENIILKITLKPNYFKSELCCLLCFCWDEVVTAGLLKKKRVQSPRLLKDCFRRCFFVPGLTSKRKGILTWVWQHAWINKNQLNIIFYFQNKSRNRRKMGHILSCLVPYNKGRSCRRGSQPLTPREWLGL